jgi:hypothetical protein
MDNDASASSTRATDAKGGPPPEARPPADPLREIDVHLGALGHIAGSLRARIDEMRQGGPVVDLVKIEERAALLSAMNYLHSKLRKLTAEVSKTGVAASALHKAEIKAAQEGLSRAQAPSGARGTPSAGAGRPDGAPRATLAQGPPSRGRKGGELRSDAGAAQHAAPPLAPLPVPKPSWSQLVAGVPRAPVPSAARRPVFVVGEIAIEAVVLPAALRTPQEVFGHVAPGDLYYVPAWKQFALRIGTCVLHANLGHIYRGAPPKGARPRGREAPERVKECRRDNCLGAGCRYYHDPETHPDAANVRNFMADSWSYTPSVTPARYGARRIGSIEHLEADLHVVGVDEARRFLHQTGHDLLCALILWQYVLGPGAKR